MPTNKKTIQKQKSLRDFFSNTKNKRLAVALVAVTAVVGAYFLFFAQAAPNNCSPVEGGGICDVNQASSPDGADAVASTNDEVQILSTQHGWTDWGVPFRAPNFPMNGAKPVHRYYRADITSHFLVIEGSADHQRVAADPANAYEGIAFYAWPEGTQPGTTPIHRINRKPLYFLQMYTDNQHTVNAFVANPDGTWEDGGVNFWAYPAGYFPPQPASTPTKDSDCANQNLRLGDKGACVQWHKGILNGYLKYNNSTGTPLDTNENTFDETTVNYTKLFAMSLQAKGVKFTNYSGVLTAEIWNAFAAGYPAVPATPTAPAQPPVVPPNPGPRPNTPAPKLPTAPAPKDPGNTDTPPPTSSPGKSPKEQCAANKGIWDSNTDACKARNTGTPTPSVPNRNPDDRHEQTSDGKAPTPPTPTPISAPATDSTDSKKTYRKYQCQFSFESDTVWLNWATTIDVFATVDAQTLDEAKNICKDKFTAWKRSNRYFHKYDSKTNTARTKSFTERDVKNIKIYNVVAIRRSEFTR